MARSPLSHANTPRDAISRVENMVMMANLDLPAKAIREQISAAIHMVVQLSCMSDGSRRVTHVTELVGMEQDIISMQDIFLFRRYGLDEVDKVIGALEPTGIRPNASEKLEPLGSHCHRRSLQRWRAVRWKRVASAANSDEMREILGESAPPSSSRHRIDTDAPANCPEPVMSLELMVSIAVFFAVSAWPSLPVSRPQVGPPARAVVRHAVRVAVVTPQRIARVNVLGKSSGRASPALARRPAQLVRPEVSRALIHANVKFGVARYCSIRSSCSPCWRSASCSFCHQQPGVCGGRCPGGVHDPATSSARRPAPRRRLRESARETSISLSSAPCVPARACCRRSSPRPMNSRNRCARATPHRRPGHHGRRYHRRHGIADDPVRCRDVDLLAAAIAINRETGGNLTEVLDTHRPRPGVRQRREVRAEANR